MKKIILSLFVALSALLQAQVFTHKISPGEELSSANAVVYALPQLVFKIDVWVEETHSIPGPYASYANRLLGLSDLITSDSKSYHIKSVALKSDYIADPNQLYYTELGDVSGKSDKSRFLQMNEAGLFGGFSPMEQNNSNSTTHVVVEKVRTGIPDFRYFADANLIEKVDTIIRRVDVDTASIEKISLKYTKIEKDLEKRAQDAALAYMVIRKNRIELISGFQEVAYPVGTFEIMNQELRQMEDDYIALFAGKKLKSDIHYVFFYTPSADQPNIIAPIFKFSEDLGLKYLSTSGGEKVSLAIKSNGLAEKLHDTNLSGVVSGLIYRFPETAEVWVKYGRKEFDKQMITIPQLGRLQNVRMGNHIFELHTKTGGLKTLEIRE